MCCLSQDLSWIDAPDEDQGLNALGFAVLHRQHGMVDLLLRHGALTHLQHGVW